jgi:tetratricopeptide (TPR) repeat protein
VKINVGETPEMRDRFNVAGIPTVILAKPGGEEIDRTLGYLTTADFTSTIDGYHKGIGTLAAMMEESKTKSGDPKFLFDFGNKLFAHKRLEDADAQFLAATLADTANASGIADDAAYGRIRIAGKNKAWDTGKSHCQEFINKWPGSELLPDATAYLGYFHGESGQKEDAIRVYNDYLVKWPEGGDAEFCREEIAKLTAPPEEN